MQKRLMSRAGRAVAVALLPASMLAAWGCSQTESARVDGVKPAPISAMPGQPEADRGPLVDMPLIDLTEPGSWVRGSAEPVIIDTRDFPVQIQEMEFDGEPTNIEELLEAATDKEGRKTLKPGTPNRLVAGGLTEQVRANPRANFPGIDATPWTPPDPALAVGPDHVLETVNMDIAWYSKDGTLQFRSRLDSSGSPGFFEDVGGGSFTFDPKCFYDHESGRFFVLALEQYSSGSQSYITFAVSDDSDPNGVWYKYRTNSRVTIGGSNYWVDYPGLGFDGDAFYVNGNLFGFNGGFGGVLFRSIDKASVLSGGTAVWTDIRNGNAGSAQATQHFGNNPAPYFIEHWSNSSVMLTAIRDPLGSPSLATKQVTVPFYNYGSDAPNNGGTISVLDGRIINSMWRDGRLVAGHGVRPSGASTTQSRWYEIDTQGWPYSGSNPTLVQSGNINGGSGIYTWFPAVYSNEAGDIGLVTAYSSSSQYASVQFTGRKASDPAGTMGALQMGTIGNQAASGRWGDYFDMAIDPDGCTFWLVGEIYRNGGWDTWLQSFTISECCRVDLNGDGDVNTQDVLVFLNLWSAGNDVADWNEDGNVNTQDVLAFLNDYNAGC